MRLSRRRTLGILAAATLPLPSTADAASSIIWRGQALGAAADIRLRHPDRKRAEAALQACREEVRYLERLFSLFRRDSAITHLNREGQLDQAPLEMIELLKIAQGLASVSDGAFDITVQPLWQAYAQGADDEAHIKAAHALVDWQGVTIDGRSIRLAHPDMAITLNGIAQGYMTDRITERLRHGGFEHVLVHLGEYRGLGQREDGRPWQVGIAHPTGEGVIEEIPLDHQAIATSSPVGTLLASNGDRKIGHLLDPKNGQPVDHWMSVSVIARRAVIADGLSTAIAIAPPDLAETLLNKGGGVRAILLARDGRLFDLQSSAS